MRKVSKSAVKFRNAVTAKEPMAYVPDEQLLLRVKNEYLTAGAVWVRRNGVWFCQQAAPILRWMRGMEIGKVKVELLRKDCTWDWSTLKPTSGARLEEPEHTYVPASGSSNAKRQ